MRRARLQIRPNLGRSAAKSTPAPSPASQTSSSISTANDVKTLDAVQDASRLTENTEKIAQQPAESKSVAEEHPKDPDKAVGNKSVADLSECQAGGEIKPTVPSVSNAVNSSDVSSKGPSRRSRLKPQVSIRQRANAIDSSAKSTSSTHLQANTSATTTASGSCILQEEQVVDNSAKDVTRKVDNSAKDVTRKVDNSAKDVTRKVDKLTEDTLQNDVDVQKSVVEEICMTSTAEVACNNSGSGQVLSPRDSARTDLPVGVVVDERGQSVTETAVKASTPRRSRFSRVTPNLAEAARRGRVRYPSMSAPEAGDTEVISDVSHLTAFSKSGTNQSCGDESAVFVPAACKVATEDEVEEENEDNDDREEVVVAKPSVKTVVNFLGTPSDKPLPERCKRRKLENLSTDVDRSKLTMRDLIHMNPVDNKMKQALEDQQTKKGKKSTETLLPTDEDTATVVNGNEDGGGDAALAKKGEDAVKKVAVDDAREDEDEEMPVPQVTIGPDGEIVINQSSLVVPTTAPKEADLGEAIEERDYSIGMAYGRKPPSKLWANKETKRFYVALSMCGTDFSLMSNFFTKRTRVELKRKFKREERHNKHLVEVALQEHRIFDVSLFQDLSSSEDEKPPVKPKRKQKTKKDTDVEKENVAKPKKKQSKKKKKKSKDLYYDSSDGGEEAVSNMPSDNDIGKNADANLGEDHRSSDDEEEVVSIAQKQTRYGRQPKPVRTFVEETPLTGSRRKRKALAVSLPRIVSPPHVQLRSPLIKSPIRLSPQLGSPRVATPLRIESPQIRSPRLVSPRMTLPPPRIASPGVIPAQLTPSTPTPLALNMADVQPGQLIFVTSTPPPVPGSDNRTPPAQVIHVYMVAPPGENPPNATTGNASEQRILKSPQN